MVFPPNLSRAVALALSVSSIAACSVMKKSGGNSSNNSQPPADSGQPAAVVTPEPPAPAPAPAPAATPPATPAPKPAALPQTPAQPVVNNSPKATSVQVQLSAASGTSGQAAVTYANVSNIVQANCANCHSGGKVAPDLSTFPFTSTAGDNLAAIMQNFSQLINAPLSTGKSMPPKATLAAADLASLNTWINAGYPAASAGNNSVDLTGDTVTVVWKTPAKTGSQSYPGAANGLITVPVGILASGDAVTIWVTVTDGNGYIILPQTAYGPMKADGSGTLKFPVPVQYGQMSNPCTCDSSGYYYYDY